MKNDKIYFSFSQDIKKAIALKTSIADVDTKQVLESEKILLKSVQN